MSAENPPIEGTGDNDFASLQTLSIGLGGGFDINPRRSLHLTPRMLFVYSHSKSDYDYNNQFSQENLSPFDKDIFGWGAEAMTYAPLFKIHCALKADRFTIVPSIRYSYVLVDSFWTNSSIHDVKSASNLTQVRLLASTPLDCAVASMPLTLDTFANRNDIYGTAESALGFRSYHEVGFTLLAGTSGIVPLFKALGISTSYAWSPEFNGWRLGLQGDIE